MRCVYLFILLLSSQLLSEEPQKKTDEKLRIESQLEQLRRPPLSQDKSKGKITQTGSLYEWKEKIGNTEVTIRAENTDPSDQWKSAWENKHPQLSNKKKPASQPKDGSKEEKSSGPSVSFSWSGTWGD